MMLMTPHEEKNKTKEKVKSFEKPMQFSIVFSLPSKPDDVKTANKNLTDQS